MKVLKVEVEKALACCAGQCFRDVLADGGPVHVKKPHWVTNWRGYGLCLTANA